MNGVESMIISRYDFGFYSVKLIKNYQQFTVIWLGGIVRVNIRYGDHDHVSITDA